MVAGPRAGAARGLAVHTPGSVELSRTAPPGHWALGAGFGRTAAHSADMSQRQTLRC